MSMFFITFFTLYAALHAYVFIKASYAFRFRPLTGCILVFVFLLCLFMPVIVRSLEQGGQESAARMLAYAGYIWMSAIFIFFVLSVAIDMGRFLTIIASSVFKVSLPGHLAFQSRAFSLYPWRQQSLWWLTDIMRR